MRRSRWPILRIGGREKFIPAPGELVSKGIFELPEYPYLRKYLAKKRQFAGPDGNFSNTRVVRSLLIAPLLRDGSRVRGD
jgi:hypothetical protein